MDVQQLFSWAARILEIAGVSIVALGSALAGGLALRRLVRDGSGPAYEELRQRVGRAILLGLEFLLGADIIRTVHEEPSFRQIGVLAAIVVIRTFLSFALHAELEGHWPWQQTVLPGARGSRRAADRREPPADER